MFSWNSKASCAQACSSPMVAEGSMSRWICEWVNQQYFNTGREEVLSGAKFTGDSVMFWGSQINIDPFVLIHQLKSLNTSHMLRPESKASPSTPRKPNKTNNRLGLLVQLGTGTSAVNVSSQTELGLCQRNAMPSPMCTPYGPRQRSSAFL